MFSLIITIISIALVAALAVASVYYGGSAFSQGTAKASASTLVAQAQQIAGAATLFANDNAGALADDIDADLVPSYLSSRPEANATVVAGDWTLVGRVVTIPLAVDAAEVAAKVQDSIGAGAIQEVTTVDEASVQALPQYGVVDTNTAATAGGLVFFYKG